MDQSEEELQQIATWFTEEGLAPDSPREAQLCLLWRALQRTRSRLNSVKWDLDTQRSQHLAEMAEVRKSLEQIRIFTEHKDVLAQEIQDENDQLNNQLQRLISLQDAQISEVAKMLYQQGLTELIHSSPSEQVAYLLVERASLLETNEGPGNLTHDGSTASTLGTEAQALNTTAHQTETRHLAGQPSSVEREYFRLERDVEEGSRRLAMAHNEIRRLNDELESAHLTQRAYEPELQAAQQEVEQLRQEVQKLKKYEMVELRKAKELNNRLDLEIRALRNRVRTLDAEKSSLQQTVVSLQEKVQQLESTQQEQQQLLAVQVQANQSTELAEVVSLQREVERLESPLQELQQQAEQVQASQVNELAKCQAAELAQSYQTCRHLQEELTAQTRRLLGKEETVVSLQREVERLESALQEQQQQAEQQLLTVQARANQANELVKSQAAELIQSNEICRDLQNKLSTQSRCLLNTESEIHSLKQQLDPSHSELDNLVTTICAKENDFQQQKLQKQTETDLQRCENTHCQQDDKELQLLQKEENTLRKECPDYQDAVKALWATQDECETLKKEICDTLKCLDKERSKYHEMKEKHKAKLCRAKQKCDDETKWRDEKIQNLERELSLCSHSVAKEKELTISITVENEKLLVERRRLLQQLDEEEHNKKASNLTASLSKCRVDFLEMENKKLGNRILHMSNQLAVVERSLQNMQSLHFAEELKKTSNLMQVFKSLPVQTSSVKLPEPSDVQSLLDNTQSKQTDATSSPHCLISGPLSRSAEMGYLNLISAQRKSDHSNPSAALGSSDSMCS
ncbi:coiled-coil domain-containing protein 30 isoform X2 [Epinephelus fuscoguttatus]|uniref:coiled-coil domain-containing protein 30 isoform X2 n=1 Tax=Epinephelus fuscoguttatus TaxID=293821 RepID=UPI0020D0C145|nr:coiled-coil domain-containing protein 30 isoform X2 [Epinephelus fuscoguttatus]